MLTSNGVIFCKITKIDENLNQELTADHARSACRVPRARFFPVHDKIRNVPTTAVLLQQNHDFCGKRC